MICPWQRLASYSGDAHPNERDNQITEGADDAEAGKGTHDRARPR